MLNAAALQSILANATEDTIVHLSYLAGSPKAVTAQAVKEFNDASDWNGDRGIPATWAAVARSDYDRARQDFEEFVATL